ncbi:unnamed protein product [Ranitomeya imitator]|uniref:USP domain-containing protein n=1 Tax=Ranitomeya imitator TaxID=111125 RepID=A0ABN9MH74_9NEOB|nr:unnamed protein product [Ranitomeya imitator]
MASNAITIRRILWLREWKADASSKSLMHLPYLSGRLFGEQLDTMISNATGEEEPRLIFFRLCIVSPSGQQHNTHGSVSPKIEAKILRCFSSSGGSVIGQLFGCEVENCSMCRCGKETVRLSTTLLFTLSYPEANSNDKIPPPDFEFVDILRRSICLEQSTQAWCENCEKYQPTVQTRNIRCLPDVLVINCEVNSTKEAEFWKIQAEDGNQGKHRVTKRGPVLSYPMFTLVTGIVGRWRAVCVTALQQPNSDAAAIRIVVGIAAASLSVTYAFKKALRKVELNYPKPNESIKDGCNDQRCHSGIQIAAACQTQRDRYPGRCNVTDRCRSCCKVAQCEVTGATDPIEGIRSPQTINGRARGVSPPHILSCDVGLAGLNPDRLRNDPNCAGPLPSLMPSVEELRNVWVPYSLKMKLSKNKELEVLNCSENEETSQVENNADEATNVYDLMATVNHVLDPRTGGSLVAHIKVGETYHQRKEGVTHQQWYLFNDFLIEPVDKCEAVQFDMNWKVPAILFYTKRSLNSKYNLTIKNPIEASVLLAEASLARKQRKCHATFIPLLLNEMPQAGELVGLDAEFVTLNQEEAELRSDGTKSTIKPSQMSVARITCVRGQGPNEGVPFIDDYISTQEQVVDYLTQYSGIKPGDLDAKISSKHLTTLKSTYLKLRFLIDVGVKFVGHGLQKDFRVINLMVPKDQVIDTVYLFNIPRKRMISLRYLAWYFLDLKIQGETHDSIEDARTALQLYRKYMELSRNGKEPDNFRKVLKCLYEKGRKMDWKVPEPESQSSPKSKVDVTLLDPDANDDLTSAQ